MDTLSHIFRANILFLKLYNKLYYSITRYEHIQSLLSILQDGSRYIRPCIAPEIKIHILLSILKDIVGQ